MKSASANSKITKAGGRQSDQNNIEITEIITVGGDRLKIKNPILFPRMTAHIHFPRMTALYVT